MSNVRKLLAKCSIKTHNNLNIKLKEFSGEPYYSALSGDKNLEALLAHMEAINFINACLSDGTNFINCKKELPKAYLDDSFFEKRYSELLQETFDCVEKIYTNDEL